MRILITNDDGAGAHGLAVLHQIAKQLTDDVWIVAPEMNQSGASHSLTLAVPLRYREIGDKAFAVRGTPADCVILGVRHILKDKLPDLVLSGVNHGANLAEDVTYSGTIAGAREGAMIGVRAIAMSLTTGFDKDGHQHWRTPLEHGPGVVDRLLARDDWQAETLINVNFPDCAPDAVTGITVTSQGRRDQGGLNVEERHDPWGNAYFWFGFSRSRSEPLSGTDLEAIANNRVSITPLTVNLTDADARTALAGAFTGSTTPARSRRV